MQDKLLDQTSVSHLFPITKFLGLLATGMTGLSFITSLQHLFAVDICEIHLHTFLVIQLK